MNEFIPVYWRNKFKEMMSTITYLVPGMGITEFQMILLIVTSAVVLVQSKGQSIRFPPHLSNDMQCQRVFNSKYIGNENLIIHSLGYCLDSSNDTSVTSSDDTIVVDNKSPFIGNHYPKGSCPV